MTPATRRAVLAALDAHRGAIIGALALKALKGEHGADGLPGPMGPRGFAGDQGDPGPQGDRGEPGQDGERGLEGPQGEKGAAGVKGDKGDKGDQGDSGEPGPQGDRGEIGIEWRGSYRAGILYRERHAVFHNGSSYIARSDTSSPPSGGYGWDMLARGADGPAIVASSSDSGSGSAALDADLTSIAALTGTGWAKRISASTWALSTPTAADVGADAAGTAAAAIATHVGLADPHAQYALESTLAAVALSGAYADLSGKPTLGSLADQDTIVATEISNSTATGRSLITAANAAAAKTVLVLVKADVGLDNVDNTADTAKPVSTAQQTALDLKANLASPALTGNPTAPTPSAGDNDTSIATTAFVTSAVPNSSYRTILDCSGSHTAAKVAGTYALGQGDPLAVGGTGTLYPLNSIFIAAADFPTVNGLAPKLRIRAQLYTNDVAPTGNFTFGLYPITRPGTSGGAGVCIFTLGTVVTGSNGASFATPVADSLLNAVSSDFALPADGHYVIAVVTTATVAASSHVHASASLQLRNA